MKKRRYDFEGTVYVDEDILEGIAEEFLGDEGPDKDWNDLNNYIWNYYSGYEDWDRVIDKITDDVFEIYEKLTDKENEEE